MTNLGLSGNVNSSAEDGSAFVTNDGTLYFKSLRGGGINGSWLYRAKLIDSTYSQVENLGGIINTGSGESEPYMAPDESYLIFISQTRTGGYGGWDLWICFRNIDSSWTIPVNIGPDINTTDDEYGPRVTHDGKYLFFTRENRGKTMDIYWVSANCINSLKQRVTSVESEKQVVPAGFSLFQNYPNPFNPSTVISYQLLVNSHATLKVYDVLGREVVTLVNEQKSAGVYQVTFDAHLLPSGVYFYRLQAGSYLETRKLVMLR
jgi:hypothetical protein